MATRVIIAGGGTGGHLFPGISLAEALRKLEPAVEICFVSSGAASESKALAEAGFQEFALPMEKLHRYLTWRLLLVPFSLYGALRKARKLVREFNPDVVVGMGGFVTGPLGMAANKAHKPLVLCEQNCYPGLSNRKLAAKATLILSAFAGAREYFPAETPFAVIGNPSRSAVRRNLTKAEACKALGLIPYFFTIVSVGGSGGARAMTRGLIDALKGMKDYIPHMQVYAQCRTEDLAQVREELADLSTAFYATDFIKDMGALYAAADIAVLRAGAGMFEALGRGVPLILIPYPFAAADHQSANANEISRAGASFTLTEQGNFSERLRLLLIELIEDKRMRDEMAECGRQVARWGAADAAAWSVMEIAHGNKPDIAKAEEMSQQQN